MVPNSVIGFCCIRVLHAVLLIMVWVSQPLHSPVYWSLTVQNEALIVMLGTQEHIHWGHATPAEQATDGNWTEDGGDQARVQPYWAEAFKRPVKMSRRGQALVRVSVGRKLGHTPLWTADE